MEGLFMSKIRVIVSFCLLLAIAVSIVNLFSMRADIAATENEIADINRKIIEQKLRNEEYEDILADANTDDFYRDVAENAIPFDKFFYFFNVVFDIF